MKNTMQKCWFLLVLLMLAACQEKEELNHVAKGSVSLKASIENSDARTSVDEEGHVSWVVADAVGVFGEETQNAKFQSISSGSSVLFVGDMSSHQDVPALAYYPYDEHATLDGNTLHFTLPSEYAYTGESKAPMLGIKQADGNFIFKHLCGLLKITVKNMPENAKRLFVVSEGTEEKEAPAIVGNVVVSDVSAEGTTLSLEEKGGHEVSIDLKNTSAQETYTFYIPVPVGEYPMLSVKLEMNDGVIYMDKRVSNVNMVRAKMLEMPVVDAAEEEEGITAIARGTVDIENPEGLKVMTMIDKTVLTAEKEFEVEMFSNDLAQFIHVVDNDDNILMMAQSYPVMGKIEINARSTALALVTMLPSFVCQPGNNFTEQVNNIESSSYFGALVNEVQMSIDAGNDIMDVGNTSLMFALSNLIDDLLSKNIETRAYYGDQILGIKNGVLDVRTLKGPSNKVTIRNTYLNPTYECFVYDSLEIEKSSHIIPTPGSLGILVSLNDWLLGEGIHYGDAVNIDFSDANVYELFCKKNTDKANVFTGLQLFSDFMSLFGFIPNVRLMAKDYFDNPKVFKEAAIFGCINSFISIAGSAASGSTSDIGEIVKSCYLELDKFLLDFESVSHDFWHCYIYGTAWKNENGEWDYVVERKWRFRENVKYTLLKKLTLVMSVYDAFKGAANLAVRIKCLIDAPPVINFKLEYNEDPWEKVICGTDTKLEILAGNEQVGLKGEQLAKPLMVAVETISDDGNDYWNEDWHDRLKVKFEVVTEDGGFVKPELVSPDYISRIASTNWFLGNSGEQKIRAVVVDAYTQLERSEPVYFTAYFEPEEEKGTITTIEATNITQTTATLSGNIQGYEADDFQHRYGFIYSTDATPLASDGTIVYSDNILEDGNYSVDVASLTQNTTYYYRAFVIDGGNYVYGDVKSFITLNEMSERDILIAFYNATDGDNWRNNTNWCSDEPLNTWEGVTTDEGGRVTRLSLRGNYPGYRFGLKGNACLSGLKNLESLSLDSNELVSLDVSGCNQLVSIYCGQNQLTEIKYEKSLCLKVLSLNDNKLTGSFDLSGCSNLESLVLSNNNLVSLDLSGCNQLAGIYCDKNQLTEIKYEKSLPLEALSLNDNKLTGLLDLSGCSNLKSLYIINNAITNLDLSGCSNLSFITCDNNKITYIDTSELTNLSYLSIGKNQLTTLDLTHNKLLSTLWCESNLLNELKIEGCDELRLLSCSNNNLNSLTYTSKKIEYFYCYDNNIESLDLNGQVNLINLQCSRNRVESLDFSDAINIEHFSCIESPLKSLYFPNNEKLEYLVCKDNNLSSLDLSKCINIRTLKCQNNQLTSLNVQNCTALKTLHCDNNQLSSLNVLDCMGLEELHCENNQLVSLFVSDNLPLKRLYCQNNKILQEITDWHSQLSTFKYDVRYNYTGSIYENGQWITLYEDNGVGWWYPGEPDRGYHKR